jgi:hypothetical protein
MPSAMSERRSTERLPIALEGWFAGEATGDPIACTVWDLSETGMRLVIPSPADIPLEFRLKIPNAQAVAMVRLVWTDGAHYGVRFTG